MIKLKKSEKCVCNKAAYPELGAICYLRKPNSLCENCKYFKSKQPIYCCQKCGETIGWLGRFIEFISFGLVKHVCKSERVDFKK